MYSVEYITVHIVYLLQARELVQFMRSLCSCSCARCESGLVASVATGSGLSHQPPIKGRCEHSQAGERVRLLFEPGFASSLVAVAVRLTRATFVAEPEPSSFARSLDALHSLLYHVFAVCQLN